MLADDYGWAVGFLGHAGYWDGDTWFLLKPADTSLNAIDMLSTTDGWIVGDDGVIFRWDINNVTWQPMPSPTSYRLNDVSMISEDDGWAVGGGWNGQDSDPGIILHWDGISWEVVTAPATAELNDIEMVTAEDGWIAGQSALLNYATPAPTLSINHTAGAPGSYFTLTGENYPKSGSLDVALNANTLGAVTADENGKVAFILSTAESDTGGYVVEVGNVVAINSVTAVGIATFELLEGAPIRPQEGSGPVIAVPQGIAYGEKVLMPGVFGG